MATPANAPRAKTRKKKAPVTADAIVDAALALAEEVGWESLRLHDLADRLGISLADLRAHFLDADAIANAWFRRAQDALLAPVPKGFYRQPARDRVEFLMLRWFDALAPHRQVTADMLRAKLWYAHPHHYVPMVFDLSRLIQWLRDAAGLDDGGRRRQVEEIGLTALFLAVLAHWCNDASDNQDRTRQFLARRLDGADRIMARCEGGWATRDGSVVQG